VFARRCKGSTILYVTHGRTVVFGVSRGRRGAVSPKLDTVTGKPTPKHASFAGLYLPQTESVEFATLGPHLCRLDWYSLPTLQH